MIDKANIKLIEIETITKYCKKTGFLESLFNSVAKNKTTEGKH